MRTKRLATALTVSVFLPFVLPGVAKVQDHSCSAAFADLKPGKKGLAAIRKAAEENDADAQYRLGCLYHYGWGVEEDRAQAKGWLGRAAGQRHALARQAFFDLQAKDEALEKQERKERIAALEKQGENGNADAQYRLGMIYRDGLGVPRDYGKAVKWFEMAAHQGMAHAQYRLGRMYYRAHGVARDYRMALFWLEMAARQQHDRALLAIGRMHETGEGAEKNLEKAKDFYRRSASRGNGKANERLRRLEREE